MVFLKVLLLFFIAFDPQIPFLPNGIGFSLFPVCVLFVPAFSIIVKNKSNQILLFAKPYFLLFFLCFNFITIRILFNDGENFEFYLSFFKALIIFTSLFFWLVVFHKDLKNNNFVYFIIFIYTLNAVINLLAGTFSGQFAFLEIFRGVPISNELGKNPYRNSYLAGSGYFSIGTAYGLASLLISFFIVRNKAKGYIFPVILSLISISGFVAARTSFFAVAPAFFYLLKARPFYFIYLIIILILLFSLVVTLPALAPYIDWMISFYNLKNEGSANYLVERMYFWPGQDVLFYGMGVVNDGTFTYTDGGYMQDILFGGMIFLLLKLSFLGVFIISCWRVFPLFTLLVSFAVLLFHFKGLFLYNNAQGMAVFYFIYFYLSHLKHNNKI